MEKKRIDVLLVEQGFFDSREKAKRAIMAGIVHNDHEIIDLDTVINKCEELMNGKKEDRKSTRLNSSHSH